ncbi:MAG TPA: putative O-glycosylation ligase, exosortase A system-associated [Candidatus Acidoferrales bacterium]|nr:putative O-glycosylation ligase, exosortase A system-associated [Candidatus Acidoferrales bacterium]
MRGIVLTIIVGLLLPQCFKDARIGILTWIWFGLMSPHRYTWGFSRNFPYAQFIALATLSGCLFHRRLKNLPMQREVILLLILWGLWTLTCFGAIHPADAWRKWAEVSKILLMVFLSLCLEWDRNWIKAMTAVTAFSVGFVGVKGALFGLRTGGEYMVLGPPGSFLEANTAVAVALDMVLPLFLILARDDQSSARLKMICYVTLALSGLSALLTYSRGGFLGLLVVGGFLLVKSRYKFLAAPAAVVALAFVLWFLPERWYGKMETIQEYEEDRSAMSRIVTWRVLWQFALEHPLTGGGFRLYSGALFDRYLFKALPADQAANWVGRWWDAHSIWFAMLAEHGFIGLFFYVLLFVSIFFSLRWLKAAARSHPSLYWMESYASLLTVSFCAFAVTGTFLDFAYFDLFFHLIGLVVVLKSLAMRQLAAADVTETVPDADAAVAGVPWRAQLKLPS